MFESLISPAAVTVVVTIGCAPTPTPAAALPMSAPKPAAPTAPVASVALPSPDALPFVVVVENLRKTGGKVCIAVFNAPEGFPREGEKAAHASCLPVTRLLYMVEVKGVSCVQNGCAIPMYHDENDNGKFDSALFGVPKEPVGFSNNPALGLSTPSFEAACFQVTSPGQRVVIQAKSYL